MKQKKNSPQPLNLLELVPQRVAKWEEKDGQIIILKPKFTHPWAVKNILPRLRKPYYRVKLDEIGSAVWQLCDGQRTVKEIGELLVKLCLFQVAARPSGNQQSRLGEKLA